MFDIIFISYNEPNAEENFAKLKARFPSAKRVKNVDGIHNAHIAAAKKSFTKMFWVVDGDAAVVDSFNFDYPVDEYNLETVHVWRSRNPVNGLEYGYGGIKLLPRLLTLSMRTDTLDMTTNISKNFKAIPEVSNITAFDTDPFRTWRSAFRECVKLTVNNDPESLARLNTWCTTAQGEFAEDAIAGAIAGRNFAQENASDPEAISGINDFEWLLAYWLKEIFQK